MGVGGRGLGVGVRCRSEKQQIRQSGPEHGTGLGRFQVKVISAVREREGGNGVLDAADGGLELRQVHGPVVVRVQRPHHLRNLFVSAQKVPWNIVD